MIVLIAEKPSVGMDLARITGCRTRRDGYMEGGYLQGEPCRVTWAFGHLLEIRQTPEQEALHWKTENLPFLPDRFILEPRRGENKEPDPGYVKQLRIIEQLYASTDRIVNCGDAGREGELIQRYIYEYVGQRNPACRKPVLRLWVSSVTDEAYREGLANLRPASEYDNLYFAARCRSEADWLVGVNATEALTLNVCSATGGRRVYSLGRVQTPTLAMVCERYIENTNFQPVPFWHVRLTTESNGTAFQVQSENRFDSYGQAESVRKRASIGMLSVTATERTPKTVPAPLLYDITTLQQDASRLYDMNPDESLAIVQKLYMAKLVTYPRTGSRFISRDVLKTIHARINNLADHSSNPQIHAAALRLRDNSAKLNIRSVNDTKVTDHHALLVEKTPPGNLPAKEQRIYDLIAIRMLEAFSPSCETEVYSCTFRCADETFKASSTRVLVAGWKAIRNQGKEQQNGTTDTENLPDQQLPELKEGMLLPVKKAETVQGQTKPKPLYTMDSLLEAMKTAGKETDDDDIKAALKVIGIGTAATRSEIIKGLMDVRKFIKKQRKKIIPTESGMEIYSLVKPLAIASVEMTGRWEIALSMIADGTMNHTDFDSRIRTYASQITRQILNLKVGDGISRAAQAENIKCPLCGATVKVWDNNARCTNQECGLTASRTVFGKKLPESTLRHLLENGKTGLVKGFISKTGKTFDARLKLVINEKEGRRYANAQLVFDDKKPQGKKPYKK